MPFFSKSSLLFILANVVRVLSIVAICLALAGEIIVIVDNVQGVNSALAAASALPTPSSNTAVVILPTLPAFTSTAVPATHSLSPQYGGTPPNVTRRALGRREMMPTSTSSSLAPASYPTAVKPSATATSPAYIGDTDVPNQLGGAVFSVTSSVFICVFLIFALLAELTPPIKFFTTTLWAYTLPSFGEDHGVGPLGVFQVFVGCTILSHFSTIHVTNVGGWFVFVLGFINMTLGLILSARIKSIRSIFRTPGSSTASGFQTLRSDNELNQTSGSRGYAEEKSTRGNNSFNGARGIQIGSPQAMPPIYAGNRRDFS